MVHITYTSAEREQYKQEPHTNKVTMTDGINNWDWSLICELREECATLATELRAKLEELQDLMWQQDQCYITDAKGDAEAIDNYTIEDYAAQVSEIENNLSIND